MAEVWVFPGQGTQRVGMGADVLDRYPDLVRQADEVLGYSIRDVCLAGAEPGLTDTGSVQPALFVVNALSYLALRETRPAPDFLAGHSLGEYDALFAAGCFDFATGVRLVRRRGELMGRASGGGMVAVVRADPDRVAALLAELGLDDVEQANRNAADQVVLAGPAEPLRRAADAIRSAGAGKCVPLRVAAAFHSRSMAAAAAEFGDFLADFALADPAVPVIANATASAYPRGGVRELLTRQIAAPVLWWESMSLLVAEGVTDLTEIGPGRVLTDLWTSARARPAPARTGMGPKATRGRSTTAFAPAPATPTTTAFATTAPAPAAPAVAASRVELSVTAPPGRIRPENLGSAGFRADYGLRYAYLAGSMFKGIASTDLVVRMAGAGLMGFFGSGGLTTAEVETAVRTLRARLGPDGRFGVNLLATPDDPAAERRLVDLLLRHGVRHVEASAHIGIGPALVRYRAAGAHRAADGTPVAPNRVLAKVSRPEVAEAFMSPPPRAVLDRLVAEGALTAAEADAAASLPVAGEVCVEADSGGHTDAGSPYSLMPAMLRLRAEVSGRHAYPAPIRVGAAGGLGAPEAVAAAFVLGADFVLTGSVNQCSPEAGTSDAVKDLLAEVDVHDTAYAPAGDMFEIGARVQVVRRGTLFPARANKLHQVYRLHDGLDDIDEATRRTIEDRYFRRSFADVWAETREYLREHRPDELERAERSPKARMALVFRWYFVHTTRAALGGVPEERVNYQIHCGPALGAFNRLVAGTPLRSWRARHVDAIAELLMTGAADLLDGSLRNWSLATTGE